MTRLLFSLLSSSTIAFCLQVAPAAAVDWGHAPLACLPDRAVRWNTPAEMEPCHCPPQSMCPTSVQLKQKDIKVHVSAGSEWDFSGEDLHLTPAQTSAAFTLTEAEWLDILDATGAFWVRARGPNGRVSILRQTHGIWQTRSITVSLARPIPELELWHSDKLKMPVALAARCCDSICPSGTAPKFVKEEIDVVDVSVAHERRAAVDAASERYAAAAEDLAAARAKLKIASGSARDAATEEVARLQHLATALEASLDLTERNLQTIPTTKRFVDSISCESDRIVSTSREGCILKGTPVTLADGTRLPIEALPVGGVIKSRGGVSQITAINEFTQAKDILYGINGGKPFISPEHPLLTTKGWRAMEPAKTSVKSGMGAVSQLEVGDKLVTASGVLPVRSIEGHELRDGVTVFNVSVDGDPTFIANEVVVKAFKEVQTHF